MAALSDIVVLSIYCLAFTVLLTECNPVSAEEDSYIYGTCEMAPNKNYDGPEVTGRVTFKQSVAGGDTEIVIDLSGFQAECGHRHGFHVHEFGDISGGCESTGGHFNPFGVDHGAPNASNRHVGDLGNVITDSEGKVRTTTNDRLVKLVGENPVLGRAVVIHEGRDDLGLEDNEGSRTTGNAGSRMACCVIGFSPGPAQ
ncbi:uncharacterized protein LOC144450815 [Glandiceps talaboti]